MLLQTVMFVVSKNGCDCIEQNTILQRESNEFNQDQHVTKTSHVKALRAKGRRVIGSSDEVHVADALAITGDEGRGSLR